MDLLTANIIRNKDQALFDNLSNYPDLGPTILMEIVNIVNKPRVHDKPPGLLKYKNTGVEAFNCYNIFKQRYTDEDNNYQSEDGIGTFDLSGNLFKCEVEVLKVIRALLLTGVSYNEDISLTCRMFVVTIIRALRPDKVLTLKEVIELLGDKSYFEKEIKRSIEDVTK